MGVDPWESAGVLAGGFPGLLPSAVAQWGTSGPLSRMSWHKGPAVGQGSTVSAVFGSPSYASLDWGIGHLFVLVFY